MSLKRFALLLTSLTFTVGHLCAQDWTEWGGSNDRNMVSPMKNIPTSFDHGKYISGTENVDMKTTKNLRWAAKLGSQAYGNVTIANGRVFVGTNNESPRDPSVQGDHSTVMCFDEKTGAFLWQLAVPKLASGKVNDWEFLGICSSPLIEGNRAYFVTNRCEVVCVDVEGLANGNQGPFKDEAAYKGGDGAPIPVGPKDADIIWRLDMREELGVFPHNITSSSVLILGDRLYAVTSNGQDWSHINIPAPKAPTLICVDKNTGKLLGEEASGISRRIMHCNWSSPTRGEIDGKEVVLFGAGDGFLYGFDPVPEVDEDGFGILKEIFRFDGNPPHYKKKDGKEIKYPAANGPSEFIGTPVYYKNRVYAAIGQDPEHGTGIGSLMCIDLKNNPKGDITKTHEIWRYNKIERSISTVAISQGLVFAPDFTGYLHCLDAETGEVQWVHDTESNIWGSPLVVDDKLYLGNEDGILLVMEVGRKPVVVNQIELDAPIYSTAVVANDTLYVGTQTHLFAVTKK